MADNKNPGLMPTHLFLTKLSRSIAAGLLIIGFSLMLGMWGYHHFEAMSWIDAFVNAAMILSGMGPLGSLQTDSGKIFAGLYALFSGIVFLVVIAIIFAPLIHRFFHRFHIEEEQTKK